MGLLLILYVYAIIDLFHVIGVMFLGENDPVFFGKLSYSMLTLFQVSTLTSWSSFQGIRCV